MSKRVFGGGGFVFRGRGFVAGLEVGVEVAFETCLVAVSGCLLLVSWLSLSLLNFAIELEFMW